MRTTFNLETPASECSPKRAFVNTRAMHNESSASLLSSNGQPKSGFSNGGQVEPRDTAELSLLSDLYQQVCGCVQAGTLVLRSTLASFKILSAVTNIQWLFFCSLCKARTLVLLRPAFGVLHGSALLGSKFSSQAL